MVILKLTDNSVEANKDGSVESETVGTLLELLLLDSKDDNHVRQVRISDKDSESQCVRFLVQGVLSVGLVDTAANITIVGRKLFK